jgi:hypothetical protein
MPRREALCARGSSAIDGAAGDMFLASVSLRRQGSSDETALLAAEFALLGEALVGLQAAIDSDATGDVDEDVLDQLATEVPDMRKRLGIGCGVDGRSARTLTNIRSRGRIVCGMCAMAFARLFVCHVHTCTSQCFQETGRRTDGRTDGTERQSDRQTDRQIDRRMGC